MLAGMSRIACAAFAGATAALVALAAAAPCVAQTHASDPAPASSAASIDFGGMSRTYRIYRPPDLAPGTRAPLVMVLHGGFGRGSGAEQHYRWDAPARTNHFVVVYPDGFSRTWNAGSCCGPAMQRNLDDVGFLSAIVKRLVDEGGIDAQRVYVTGISNGAMMAYRMACEATIPIAAIGPVAGTLTVPCDRPHATSVLDIHGLDDRLVPFNGGIGAGFDRSWRTPVPATVARWRLIDRCRAPAEMRAGPVTTQIASCADGHTVELITIAGAGHQWPGGAGPPVHSILGMPLDAPTKALDATATLWKFFAAHTS